jgi:hypothetical protein
MALLNQGINIGHSSNLIYDRCSYADYVSESVAPVLYRLNPNQINNCNACLSTFGPRTSSGPRSHGVSSTVGHVTAPSQKLVDVESVLSNRNVIISKCKEGKVNDIDVTKFNLEHARICNDFLDPLSTLLTNPPANYRGMSINRFFNLPKPAQENIYYDIQINSKLEARDNYRERIPRLRNWDPTMPVEEK